MSELHDWARTLGGEVRGDQVFCPGPGHSAKDRSLSVTIGKDGQPVVHSHAGDDWKECRDYVLQRLGMEPWKPNGGRKTVATYEFCDPATGEVRYRKERLEAVDGTKSFFITPKGRGGSEPLLYGGERLADLAEGQHVFVVEGEKMVNRLRELGAAAVSGDSGYESKWLPAYADLLRGLHVVMWPDSDDPGEKYIARAAECLRNSAASLRVVRPFGKPNGAKGRDVCDWTGNAEDLAALAAGAGAYEAREERAPPEPDRSRLTLSAWLDRDIPLRDYLLGGVMCTTSRWFIFGETGIGKTLIAMEMAAAIAIAAAFLKWPGQRRTRVMYLDGELPMETFKERVQLIADRHGKDFEFYGYNREDLGDDGMPPLNTETGQAWLKREIAAVKPDLIIFDSVMCLLIGSMSEEATWMPVRPFVRWLSAQRIAQVWLHHANDIGKSFGDKTREWEMEAVVKLSKVQGDETAILWEFVKARLRTPKTAAQFLPIVIRPDYWEFEGAAKSAGKRNEAEAVADAFLNALDRLADGVTKTPGFDGNPVSKVKVDNIRGELKKRGFLEKNEKGQLSSTGKSHFRRAKTALLSAGKIFEDEDLVWRK